MGNNTDNGTDAKPRRRAQGLNRENILEACLHLAADAATDTLSFRKIGKELGADPTALYRHFADKDELLLALADRVLAMGMEGYEQGPYWDVSLQELLLRARASFLRYPSVATLAALRVTRQEGELKFVEAMLAVLKLAGFEPREAALIHRACADFMLAWTGFSAGLLLLGEKSSEDDKAWVASYAKVPRADYPLAVASVGVMAEVQDDENYRFAMGLMIDGIAARLGKGTGKPRG